MKREEAIRRLRAAKFNAEAKKLSAWRNRAGGVAGWDCFILKSEWRHTWAVLGITSIPLYAQAAADV